MTLLTFSGIQLLQNWVMLTQVDASVKEAWMTGSNQ